MNDRFWPIADIRPGSELGPVLMSAFDPKRPMRWLLMYSFDWLIFRSGMTMQLKDVAVPALFLLGMPLCGWSQTAEDIRAWDEMYARELARLPEAVRSYANSIGCAVTFRPNDVVRWEGAPREVAYLALIVLDDGCAGGSGTWRSTFVAVREGAYGKLFIHARYSSPELTSGDFPQVIDSIYNTRRGVRFVGRIPQGHDPRNMPTKRVSGAVYWSGQGWTVVDGECKGVQC